MIRRYSTASNLIYRRFINDGNIKCITSGSNLRCSNNFSSSSRPSNTGSTIAKSTTSTTTAANNSNSNNKNDATNRNSKLLDQWLEAWNEHSGTHEITKLKQLVHNSSLKFDRQQRLVTTARKAVDDALSTWEQSQIQHAQLLQVREKWTPAQALEFAKLLEREVQVRSELERAKKDLAEKEVHQSQLQIDYMNNLRKRYHEEQIWTDRWRILSTYGTWGLIALNSVVFLISQYLFKLRERSRMKDFEILLKETLSSNNSTMLAIREHQNDIVEQQQQQQQQRSESWSSGKSEEGRVDEQSLLDVEKEEGEKKVVLSNNDDDDKEESNSEHDALNNVEQEASDDNDGDSKPKLLESNESKKSKPSSRDMQQPVLLTNIKSKLAKLDRDETKFATIIQQASQSLVLGWTKLQIRVAASAKKVEYVDKIDLPSAALGACVASMAWLVAMSLPRKGGQ